MYLSFIYFLVIYMKVLQAPSVEGNKIVQLQIMKVL